MLEYNEILPGKFIVVDGQPYEVLDAHVFRKQQRKPVNATKLKNTITGRVLEKTYQAAESAVEADLTKKKVVFIYHARGEAWFHDEGSPGNRFSLPSEKIANELKYLKPKMVVDALEFEDKVIGITIPIKVELLVTEAAPAVRGNTAQNATKQVTLETGTTVAVPIFINEGDVIRVNTQTGLYVERTEKK